MMSYVSLLGFLQQANCLKIAIHRVKYCISNEDIILIVLIKCFNHLLTNVQRYFTIIADGIYIILQWKTSHPMLNMLSCRLSIALKSLIRKNILPFFPWLDPLCCDRI